MTPLRLRYSVAIIVLSIVILYFSGSVLVTFVRERGHTKEDYSIITADEDKAYQKSPHYINAVTAFNNKNYRLAADELNEEIEKNPNHAQAYFLLGSIYEEGEPGGAPYFGKMIKNYENYLRLKPHGKRMEYVKLRLAQYYVRVGLTQQQVELINKAEEYLKTLDQTDSNVKMALGAVYLNNQNYDKAIAAFERSSNLPPSELKLKYNSLGLAYIKKKAYGKAEGFLQIAIKIDPNDKYAHNNLGFVYSQRGMLKEARTHFAEALALDPSYSNAARNLKWVEEIEKKNRRTPN